MHGAPDVETMPFEIRHVELLDYVFDSHSYLRFGEGAQSSGVLPGEEMVFGTWHINAKVIVEPRKQVSGVRDGGTLRVLSSRRTFRFWEVESYHFEVVGIFQLRYM